MKEIVNGLPLGCRITLRMDLPVWSATNCQTVLTQGRYRGQCRVFFGPSQKNSTTDGSLSLPALAISDRFNRAVIRVPSPKSSANDWGCVVGFTSQ